MLKQAPQKSDSSGWSGADSVRSSVPELCSLAARGLVAMVDPDTQLFCYRLKQTPSGLVREGISHRYTMMSLLGLHRFETGTGRTSTVPIGPIFGKLTADLGWVNNFGDFGLLLWLSSVVRPDYLKEVYSRFGGSTSLSRFQGGQENPTMELAWLLTGLSYAALVGWGNLSGLTDLAAEVYSLLRANQGAQGFFGHLASKGTITGVLRGRIGSFADQVYPIYGLSKFGLAFQDQNALDRALKCANAICAVQGQLGQWWWHYDSATGRVFQRYPVYSVHQHAMGPMALFAACSATQSDFRKPIYKGLSWIDGNNELKTSLRAPSSNLVWRSAFRPNELQMYAREFLDYLRPTDEPASASGLEINFECRPYELGWLLYAFCGPDCREFRKGI